MPLSNRANATAIKTLIALNTFLSGAALNYIVNIEHRITALETQVSYVRQDQRADADRDHDTERPRPRGAQ